MLFDCSSAVFDRHSRRIRAYDQYLTFFIRVRLALSLVLAFTLVSTRCKGPWLFHRRALRYYANLNTCTRFCRFYSVYGKLSENQNMYIQILTTPVHRSCLKVYYYENKRSYRIVNTPILYTFDRVFSTIFWFPIVVIISFSGKLWALSMAPRCFSILCSWRL